MKRTSLWRKRRVNALKTYGFDLKSNCINTQLSEADAKGELPDRSPTYCTLCPIGRKNVPQEGALRNQESPPVWAKTTTTLDRKISEIPGEGESKKGIKYQVQRQLTILDLLSLNFKLIRTELTAYEKAKGVIQNCPPILLQTFFIIFQILTMREFVKILRQNL